MDIRKKKQPPRHLPASAENRPKRPARPSGNTAGKTAPARPALREESNRARGSAMLFQQTLLPKVEHTHRMNQMGLKIGVIWLFALPVLLAVIRIMTDSSKIAFLMIWIVGMFLIAGALVFVAYSDSELKRYLEEVKRHVPAASETELGGLVDLEALREELGELPRSREELHALIQRRLNAEREEGEGDAE